MNLEINLYTTIDIDFKGSRLKESIKKIIREIYKDCVIKNDYFTFTLTKEKEKIKTTD
jgi:5S rRNA maturation endonuclease (ribonuclease M5)